MDTQHIKEIIQRYIHTKYEIKILNQRLNDLQDYLLNKIENDIVIDSYKIYKIKDNKLDIETLKEELPSIYKEYSINNNKYKLIICKEKKENVCKS